jgi:hypothetical protein
MYATHEVSLLSRFVQYLDFLQQVGTVRRNGLSWVTFRSDYQGLCSDGSGLWSTTAVAKGNDCHSSADD